MSRAPRMPEVYFHPAINKAPTITISWLRQRASQYEVRTIRLSIYAPDQLAGITRPRRLPAHWSAARSRKGARRGFRRENRSMSRDRGPRRKDRDRRPLAAAGRGSGVPLWPSQATFGGVLLRSGYQPGGNRVVMSSPSCQASVMQRSVLVMGLICHPWRGASCQQVVDHWFCWLSASVRAAFGKDRCQDGAPAA